MPVDTNFGTLSIGKDIAVDLALPNNTILRMSNVTNFQRKQDAKGLQSKGLDGIVRQASIPDGWSGSFDLHRADSALDDFFANLEAGYYGGQTMRNSSITETIIEAGGTISQYRYLGVSVEFTDAGSWKSDDFITQKVSWKASQRIKVQ